MRKAVIFCLLSIPGMLTAQHSLQSNLNMFRAEDLIIKQQVSYKDPGRAGMNVLWDFSELDVENDDYGLLYSDGINSIHAGLSSMILGVENVTESHYKLSGDSLLLLGFRKYPGTVMKHKQGELLLKFPVSYGDETKSYYYSHGVHGNFFELNDMGTVKFHADAYGMMVMPDKDTLKNVLRTHTIKHTVSDVTTISNEYVQKDTAWYYISPDSIDFRVASNDIIFVDEIFRWYAKGYRYPVFETVSSWVKRPDNSIVEQLQKKSFFYPPEEHYYLETDAENLAQLKPHDPDAGFTYNFSPNPVKETPLNVELYLPKPAKNIRLQLRTLTGVLVLEENKGSLSAGIRHLQLNTSTVPAGNYIFVIVRDGHSVGKVLLKR